METKHITVEHLIAYAAQELSEGEAKPVRDHLVVCPECNAFIVSFKRIRKLVCSEHIQEPPQSAIERAYAIFQQHRTNASPNPTWTSLFRLFMIV